MHKCSALLLILVIMLSSLYIVKSSFTQSVKPTVPEFTLKFVKYPYDVAPTTTIDPYTGKTITIQEGYRVENSSIEVIIKNQPFSPYKSSNGNYVRLSYNISIKGHYSDDWKYYPDAYWKIPLVASQGDYTVISFGSNYNESDPYSYRWDVPDSGQVDVRVEALIGYYNETVSLYPIPGGEFHFLNFVGESSGWSNTQTLNINDGSITTNPSTTPSSSPTSTALPSQNPTAISQQPSPQSNTLLSLDWEQVAIILLCAAVVVLVLTLVFSRRRRAKQTKWQSSASVPQELLRVLRLCP